jgi:hypothetical protein
MPNLILDNPVTAAPIELISILTTSIILPTTGFANLCSVNLPVGTWDLFGHMSVSNVNVNGTLPLLIGSGGGGAQLCASLTMRNGFSNEGGVSGWTRINVSSGTLTCLLQSGAFNSGFTNPTALAYNPTLGTGTILIAKKIA